MANKWIRQSKHAKRCRMCNRTIPKGEKFMESHGFIACDTCIADVSGAVSFLNRNFIEPRFTGITEVK